MLHASISPVTKATLTMTNEEFAERVGIDFTFASRLRNGQRVCSADLLDRIALEFHLPHADLHAARRKGPITFGKYLREMIFNRVTEADDLLREP